MGLPADYPDNYVIVVDEYGEEVHDHPVTGVQVSWTHWSWRTTEAAQLVAGQVIACESDPAKILEDYRDRDYGGPDVNHYRCVPSMHSRDISRDNIRSQDAPHKPVVLPDGRRIFAQLCSHCRAPLFYCTRAEWYFHLGLDVTPCWRHNQESWDLGTAGFQVEDGIPEPPKIRVSGSAGNCPPGNPADHNHHHRHHRERMTTVAQKPEHPH